MCASSGNIRAICSKETPEKGRVLRKLADITLLKVTRNSTATGPFYDEWIDRSHGHAQRH
jgi:hypothetical protein